MQELSDSTRIDISTPCSNHCPKWGFIHHLFRDKVPEGAVVAEVRGCGLRTCEFGYALSLNEARGLRGEQEECRLREFDGNRGGCHFLEHLRLSPQGRWEDLCVYDTPSYLKHRPLYLESSGVASRLALRNEQAECPLLAAMPSTL